MVIGKIMADAQISENGAVAAFSLGCLSLHDEPFETILIWLD